MLHGDRPLKHSPWIHMIYEKVQIDSKIWIKLDLSDMSPKTSSKIYELYNTSVSQYKCSCGFPHPTFDRPSYLKKIKKGVFWDSYVPDKLCQATPLSFLYFNVGGSHYDYKGCFIFCDNFL